MKYATLFSLILTLGKVTGVLGISWFWAMFPLIVIGVFFASTLAFGATVGLVVFIALCNIDTNKMQEVGAILKELTNGK